MLIIMVRRILRNILKVGRCVEHPEIYLENFKAIALRMIKEDSYYLFFIKTFRLSKKKKNIYKSQSICLVILGMLNASADLSIIY